MSYYLAMSAGILLTGFAQVLMKRGAASESTWLQNFLNWRTLTGYGIFGFVTVLNLYALQSLELKTVSAWAACTYVWVIVLSWKLLQEKIDGRTALGCVLIVLGIIIFNTNF